MHTHKHKGLYPRNKSKQHDNDCFCSMPPVYQQASGKKKQYDRKHNAPYYWEQIQPKYDRYISHHQYPMQYTDENQ